GVAHVGNSPVVEVRIDPMQELVTLARQGLAGSSGSRFCRPNKEINEMFASLVNQSCYRPIVEIIKATPKQGKALAAKINDDRCEIELHIQPWFHSVLIRRGHVCKMVRHQ